MARVRSTARVTRDREEAEGAETAPISEVMQRSGLVVSEDAHAAEAEQVDVEEIESEDDCSVVPTKPSHLEFGKSTISEGDMSKLMNLGLSGTIIRGTVKTPNSQLVTPISTKLQRPDGCD
jgi:hypothetical protein